MKKLAINEIGAELWISDSIGILSQYWQPIHLDAGLMDLDFLQSIEKSPPIGMSFLYGVLKRNDKILTLLYFQILPFQAGTSLKIDEPCEGFFDALSNFSRKYLANFVSFTTLVCGNLLVAGPNGLAFSKEIGLIERQQYLSLCLEAIHHHPKFIKNASVTLIKDYPGELRLTALSSGALAELYEFSIQPGMRMHIRDEWDTFQQYLDALHSKYRLRYKKADKHAAALELVEWDYPEIKKNIHTLHQLYHNVANQAGFNMVSLNEMYILSMKEQLKDRFRLFVYLENGHPIGFFSYIVNQKELVAHYLGFDPQKNVSYHLYLNMLYNLVKEAIVGNFDQIDFARTALEIKSTIGAESEDLYCYISHNTRWYNKFVPKLLEFLKPVEDWTPRHPFKAKTKIAVLEL